MGFGPSAVWAYRGCLGSGWLLFFFQAEDGIRDWSVTGVQTCALPISTVERLHGGALRAALERAGIGAEVVALPPGEATKNFAELERLCDALLAKRIERGDMIVAFGGGVIGDLAGFAAGVVLRGIDYVQVPTTLLAQVDSSVGGKTAIDTRH